MRLLVSAGSILLLVSLGCGLDPSVDSMPASQVISLEGGQDVDDSGINASDLLILALASEDSDNDGLSDYDELNQGLDPDDPTDGPDRDGDGIPNEADSDVDGDGVINKDDPDIDGDGIFNGFDLDIDGDHIANASDLDMDGDGIPNRWDSDIDGDFSFNDEESSNDKNGGDDNPVSELTDAGKEALSRALADNDCGPFVNDCATFVREVVEEFNERVLQADSIFAVEGLKDQVNEAMDGIVDAARDRGELNTSGDEGFAALLRPDQPMFDGLDAVASNMFDAFAKNPDDADKAAKDFAARATSIAALSKVHDSANLKVVGDQVFKLRGDFKVKELAAVTEFVGANAKQRDLNLEDSVAALLTVRQAYPKATAADLTAAMNDAMDKHFGDLSKAKRREAVLNMALGTFNAREDLSLTQALDAAAELAAAGAIANSGNGDDSTDVEDFGDSEQTMAGTGEGS